jgi:outer membrane protein assembly factor BamD (BamD/ComL family)
LSNGKYEASLKETRELLRLYRGTLGDEALFQMGLIYAYPKNPDHDYEKSIAWFHSLIEDFPQSKNTDQAEAWVLLLQDMIKKEQEVAELESRVEELKEQLLKLKEVDLGLQEKKSQVK